jgi:hypothetical protein
LFVAPNFAPLLLLHLHLHQCHVREGCVYCVCSHYYSTCYKAVRLGGGGTVEEPLWETFVCTTLGLEVPALASLPRRNQRSPALCGCKKHGMDLYGDHTSTCTAHSGATKAHDWAVGVLGPLFRTAGHVVRTQHGVTTSAGQRRGDVEVRHYLHDTAGSRSLVFDLSITHDRIGSSCHVSRTVCYRILRTLTPPCGSLRSAKLTAIGSNTLTTRTFLFSPSL